MNASIAVETNGLTTFQDFLIEIHVKEYSIVSQHVSYQEEAHELGG